MLYEFVAESHHVEIHDAGLHHHEKAGEVYYVNDGHGTMVLDGEEIEQQEGAVVRAPRGVRHDVHGLE